MHIQYMRGYGYMDIDTYFKIHTHFMSCYINTFIKEVGKSTENENNEESISGN